MDINNIPETEVDNVVSTAIAQMSDNGHALISPSGASTWMGCVGSVIGIHEHRKTAPDNIASIDGTCAHFLLEISLLHMIPPNNISSYHFDSANGIKLTDEMLRDVDKWLYRIRNNPGNTDEVIEAAIDFHRYVVEVDFPPDMRMEIQKSYDIILKEYLIFGWTLIPELKVILRNLLGHDQCDGTSDVILYRGNEMLVVDLKYGIAIPVSPLNNKQLRIYAGGAIDYVYQNTGIVIDKLTLVIMQSRIDDGVWKVWETSYAELYPWLINEVRPAAIKSLYAIGHPEEATDDWYTPSESACRWCHQRTNCRARRVKAIADVRHMFVVGNSAPAVPGDLVPTPIPAQELSDVALTRILDAMPFIMSWFKDAETEALKRVKRGKNIGGRKMVKGRKKREWPFKDADAIQKFVALGASPDQFMNTKIKSPAQIEATAMDSDVRAALMGLVKESFGNDVLALSSDHRVAVTPLTKVLDVIKAAEQ